MAATMHHRSAHLALAFLLLSVAACSSSKRAATPGGSSPEDGFDVSTVEQHVRFLGSDALMGRRTGEPGNDAAADYVAQQFEASGAQQVPGADGFFQHVPFERTAPAAEGALELQGRLLSQGQQMLILNGGALDETAEVVFVGFGLADDYDGLDASGKIAVAMAGRPDDPSVRTAFRATPEKMAAALDAGADALVELYTGSFAWNQLATILGTPRMGLKDDDADDQPELPHAWIDNTSAPFDGAALDGTQATFVSSGTHREEVTSNNVVAMIEGTDPALRDQFVVLTAHYDHLGAGMHNGGGATPADSIFNGARDNAIGTVAVMMAAKAFAQQPPARSVLFIALTAEENGLLGSRYYVNHALLPLDKMVYALNIDGAGYSDTTIVTLVDKGRTTADDAIERGAAAFGLDVIDDPAPEENLFDRSDNVNFARKGIPAPTFSLGFRGFDEPGISNYYHRPQDEADDLNFRYVTRFTQAYTRAARNVANMKKQPFWLPGDKYEAAGKALYGMN